MKVPLFPIRKEIKIELGAVSNGEAWTALEEVIREIKDGMVYGLNGNDKSEFKFTVKNVYKDSYEDGKVKQGPQKQSWP